MIIVEFIIFVVSSGLFCSERFRGHLWAVLVAGAIATGSSLLFFYHLGAKMMGQEPTPAVITKIVKQTVLQPVLPNQPASASKDKPHTCSDHYPTESATKGEVGTTKLAFRILTDGTVKGVRVVVSSGSPALDEAAIKCVGGWHYNPAIKDGKLAEVDSTAQVKWVLPESPEAKAEAPSNPDAKKEEKKPEEPAPAAEAAGENQKGHAWYDPTGWFSSEPEKKQPQQ